MATIEYKFSDGHIEDIEVTEEFAKQYKEIDKEYFRNEEKFDWRTRNKEMSLERLQKEFGMDMPDDAPAVDEYWTSRETIMFCIIILKLFLLKKGKCYTSFFVKIKQYAFS